MQANVDKTMLVSFGFDEEAGIYAAGYRIIDGIDLSEAMIEVAAGTGLYRRLEAGVDLTRPPPKHCHRSPLTNPR